MTLVHEDPERREDAMLAALLPELTGTRVLEVGCGSGRLTRKYAARARHVLAVDTDAAAIESFRRAMPADLQPIVEARAGEVGRLDLREGTVDLVLLSWAL